VGVAHLVALLIKQIQVASDFNQVDFSRSRPLAISVVLGKHPDGCIEREQSFYPFCSSQCSLLTWPDPVSFGKSGSDFDSAVFQIEALNGAESGGLHRVEEVHTVAHSLASIPRIPGAQVAGLVSFGDCLN
jgi:hypothetical protein